MRRIGIYGGSFNPVHFGHVGLAKWVIENTDLDELWLMVSPLNPLKASMQTSNSDSCLTSNFYSRLDAVRKAVKDIPRVRVSDFEASLPRPSYTANTLRELQKKYPDYDFTLVIGEDNLAVFDQWREYDYILQNFRIFVYPRTSSVTSGTLTPGSIIGNIIYLDSAPLFNISSTELRNNQHS